MWLFCTKKEFKEKLWLNANCVQDNCLMDEERVDVNEDEVVVTIK